MKSLDSKIKERVKFVVTCWNPDGEGERVRGIVTWGYRRYR